MYIHTFGAYFGLAVSRILYTEESTKSKKSEPVYHSDLFSYIGTSLVKFMIIISK